MQCQWLRRKKVTFQLLTLYVAVTYAIINCPCRTKKKKRIIKTSDNTSWCVQSFFCFVVLVYIYCLNIKSHLFVNCCISPLYSLFIYLFFRMWLYQWWNNKENRRKINALSIVNLMAWSISLLTNRLSNWILRKQYLNWPFFFP